MTWVPKMSGYHILWLPALPSLRCVKCFMENKTQSLDLFRILTEAKDVPSWVLSPSPTSHKGDIASVSLSKAGQSFGLSHGRMAVLLVVWVLRQEHAVSPSFGTSQQQLCQQGYFLIALVEWELLCFLHREPCGAACCRRQLEFYGLSGTSVNVW